MATYQVVTEQHGELNCWRISSDRAELLIAQQGAQILSYQRVGEPPLLWLSDQAIFRQGKSVRAGVPVCWPWFGNLQRNPQAVQAMYHGEQAPAHGLARSRDWQLLGIEEAGTGLRIEFQLPEARGDLPGWPHDVELKLVVELDEALKLNLTSRNMGNTPLPSARHCTATSRSAMCARRGSKASKAWAISKRWRTGNSVSSRGTGVCRGD